MRGLQASAGAALSEDQAPSGADGQAAEPARKRQGPLLAALAAIAVTAYAIDQGTKAWAVAALPMGESRPFLGEVLQLRRTANPGAAFSIATNATWLLTIIAVIVIAGIIFVARRLRSRGWAVALGLLLGGALGNLTDRFFREPGGGRGHVVDFLELPRWPIFNFADTWVVTAAALICLLAFRGIGVDGTRVTDERAAEPDAPVAEPDAASPAEVPDSTGHQPPPTSDR